MGSEEQKSYKYAYDKSGKLKSATYQVSNAVNWTDEVNAQNESMTYDHNGNLKTLQRNQRKYYYNGLKGTYVSEAIDNLTYTYSATVPDQLLKVTDAVARAEGFNNSSSGTSNDFTYDANGNTPGLATIIEGGFNKRHHHQEFEVSAWR